MLPIGRGSARPKLKTPSTIKDSRVPIRESIYGYWSSPRAFVWVCAGATIGIGNMARLPWLAGQYGGGAFLIAYLLALCLIALPMLIAEWLVGRWTRPDLLSGFERLAQDAGGMRRGWKPLAVLALLSALLTLAYYSVVAGWSVGYIFRAAGGELLAVDAGHSRDVFLGLVRDPERSLAWHTIFLLAACIIVSQGVREGLERGGRYLLGAAFLLLLCLMAYAARHGDVGAALHYLFAVDFSRLGWRGAMEAVQQAVFSVSLGLGVMLAYGGYLHGETRLMRAAVSVIALDTFFALGAGIAINALLFGAGLSPVSGLALLFQAVPMALPGIPMSIIVATGFYMLVVAITLASAIALMEPLVAWLMIRYRLPRTSAATAVAMVAWFLGIGAMLSFGVLDDARLAGRNPFEWMQWLTARLLIPVGVLLSCIAVGRVLPLHVIEAGWGSERLTMFRVWRQLLRFPARIGLAALLLYTLGLLDRLEQLW